jgi:hypothetical protein
MPGQWQTAAEELGEEDDTEDEAEETYSMGPAPRAWWTSCMAGAS